MWKRVFQICDFYFHCIICFISEKGCITLWDLKKYYDMEEIDITVPWYTLQENFNKIGKNGTICFKHFLQLFEI